MTDETYCGAEFGETRDGECECQKCAPADHPDPLQDWPMPGHLKPDAGEREPWQSRDGMPGYHPPAPAEPDAGDERAARIAQAIEALAVEYETAAGAAIQDGVGVTDREIQFALNVVADLRNLIARESR